MFASKSQKNLKAREGCGQKDLIALGPSSLVRFGCLAAAAAALAACVQAAPISEPATAAPAAVASTAAAARSPEVIAPKTAAPKTAVPKTATTAATNTRLPTTAATPTALPPAETALAVTAPTAPAGAMPSVQPGDALIAMKQFADAEANFALYIPAGWDVLGPDHNAIGSQFIVGPPPISWSSGEPAALEISVIDIEQMTLTQALEMLCAVGCKALPVPQPITLTNGLPAQRAVAESTTAGAQPLEWYIVGFGRKEVIFALDQARAGMDWDMLLKDLGPLDGTKPSGEPIGRMQYEGISLALGKVAAYAAGESVAAVIAGADAPWWEPAPKHPEMKLIYYALEDTIQTPRIVVYPAHELADANPEAARRVEALKQLIEQKTVDPSAQLPLLPLVNAGEQVRARVKFVSFQNGRGVSYLTQLGQGPGPIDNRELFYTFQGLTDDGAHYVAAILPVSHPSLPASADAVSQADVQALGQDWARYAADTTRALAAQDAASFKPGLDELDALVESINVGR